MSHGKNHGFYITKKERWHLHRKNLTGAHFLLWWKVGALELEIIPELFPFFLTLLNMSVQMQKANQVFIIKTSSLPPSSSTCLFESWLVIKRQIQSNNKSALGLKSIALKAWMSSLHLFNVTMNWRMQIIYPLSTNI